MQNAHISQTIKKLCNIQKITITQLQQDCGLSKSFIYDLEKRSASPSCLKITKIADYLNCSVDYLLGRTDNPNLNTFSKPSEVIESKIEKSRIIPLYETRVSAGTGSWLSADVPVEWMTVPQNEQTAKADYMLKVVGDSMQPKYFDGDFILIKESPSILEGEIGIFIVNSESFLKKMGKGELISLNPTYEPIKFTEYDDVRCAGKVIGTIKM